MSTAKLKSQLAAARSAVQAAGVAIEKLRTSIAALKAERAAVAGVPLPIDQALDTLRRHLDNLASSAGSTLESVAITAASGSLQSALLPQPRDPLLLFAVLARGPVEEALTAAIRRFYEDRQLVGMSPDARDARLAEIDRQIAALEHEEEQTIAEAEELGLTIPRRTDVDPAIILGLRE